jgi:hypothetical protein
MGSAPPSSGTPVVGMAATNGADGYWLVTSDKALAPSGPVPTVLAQCDQSIDNPDVEPALIVLACGDGNASLEHLVWSSWTATSATGRGQFVHNTCDPDCAEGTFVSAAATVRLAYPVQTNAGREFAGLSYSYADPTSRSGHTTDSEVAPTSPG